MGKTDYKDDSWRERHLQAQRSKPQQKQAQPQKEDECGFPAAIEREQELFKCGGTGRLDLSAMDAAIAEIAEAFRIAKENRGVREQHISVYEAASCFVCNPHGHSFERYKEILDAGGDPSEEMK